MKCGVQIYSKSLLIMMLLVNAFSEVKGSAPVAAGVKVTLEATQKAVEEATRAHAIAQQKAAALQEENRALREELSAHKGKGKVENAPPSSKVTKFLLKPNALDENLVLIRYKIKTTNDSIDKEVENSFEQQQEKIRQEVYNGRDLPKDIKKDYENLITVSQQIEHDQYLATVIAMLTKADNPDAKKLGERLAADNPQLQQRLIRGKKIQTGLVDKIHTRISERYDQPPVAAQMLAKRHEEFQKALQQRVNAIVERRLTKLNTHIQNLIRLNLDPELNTYFGEMGVVLKTYTREHAEALRTAAERDHEARPAGAGVSDNPTGDATDAANEVETNLEDDDNATVATLDETPEGRKAKEEAEKLGAKLSRHAKSILKSKWTYIIAGVVGLIVVFIVLSSGGGGSEKEPEIDQATLQKRLQSAGVDTSQFQASDWATMIQTLKTNKVDLNTITDANLLTMLNLTATPAPDDGSSTGGDNTNGGGATDPSTDINDLLGPTQPQNIAAWKAVFTAAKYDISGLSDDDISLIGSTLSLYGIDPTNPATATPAAIQEIIGKGVTLQQYLASISSNPTTPDTPTIPTTPSIPLTPLNPSTPATPTPPTPVATTWRQALIAAKFNPNLITTAAMQALTNYLQNVYSLTPATATPDLLQDIIQPDLPTFVKSIAGSNTPTPPPAPPIGPLPPKKNI